MSFAEYHLVQRPDDYIQLDKPGTIRWASGSPDGLRSMTWQVIGHRNTDDVYIGARGLMHDQKLSLHESGRWRWAFTKEAAERYLRPGDDALLKRYSPPVPFKPGWRHGARIRTPSTTFGPAFDEPRPRDRQPIRFFAPPDNASHLEYYVLIGDAGAQPLDVETGFVVGGMPLTSGKWVWVTGWFWEMDEEFERAIAQAYDLAAKHPDVSAGVLWGNVGRVPHLTDFADLRRRDQMVYDGTEDA
jgi:hypothetical protein